ncbi:MAG TPA: glycoside hydrolase family 5 protein [bacterium]|nr:glycoside hydrolase family 5 protein [bacterium]HPN43314.1 glycoside hydrolase family 5 protein [bacterium]
MNRCSYKTLLLLLPLLVLIISCSGKDKNPVKPKQTKYKYDPPSTEPLDPFVQNQLLAKSINLSTLEAESEAAWGRMLDEEYFQLIKDIGFTAIRLPVRWSTHMMDTAPFTVDEAWLQRVEWAVNQALSRDLAIIVNSHHFDGIFDEPDTYREKFLASWETIAEYFKNYPDELFFEILNEPNANLTPAKWNILLKDALAIIRKTNPGRTVIIGPTNWNGYDALPGLDLPEDDQNIIVTFHYYLPFNFTHQGAGDWVDGANEWLGTKWIGSINERNMVDSHLDFAVRWAQQHNRPLFLGEFGSYYRADNNSRLVWTSYIARSAEDRSISWGYWEFHSGFGVYDPDSKKWNDYLIYALLEKKLE